VLAEDPAEGFLPATGEISHLKEPGGPGCGSIVPCTWDESHRRLRFADCQGDCLGRRSRAGQPAAAARPGSEFQIGGVPYRPHFFMLHRCWKVKHLSAADGYDLSGYFPPGQESGENCSNRKWRSQQRILMHQAKEENTAPGLHGRRQRLAGHGLERTNARICALMPEEE
jgi:hypothetical protein